MSLICRNNSSVKVVFVNINFLSLCTFSTIYLQLYPVRVDIFCVYFFTWLVTDLFVMYLITILLDCIDKFNDDSGKCIWIYIMFRRYTEWSFNKECRYSFFAEFVNLLLCNFTTLTILNATVERTVSCCYFHEALSAPLNLRHYICLLLFILLPGDAGAERGYEIACRLSVYLFVCNV